jgi:CRISPR system Cascade subunit CasC
VILELHIIQNFAPANLNRDDMNAPKDCEFGGRRARISSRASSAPSARIRGKEPIDAEHRGLRTAPGRCSAVRLAGHGPDEVLSVVGRRPGWDSASPRARKKKTRS